MTVAVLLFVGGLLFFLGYCIGSLSAIRDEMEWLEAYIKECHVTQDR